MTKKDFIKKQTIPWEDFTKNFTEKEWAIVAEERKFYKILAGLHNARKEAKLTQSQLAKKANLPRSTVSKIESGTYNPTIKTLMSLARAMGKELVVRFE